MCISFGELILCIEHPDMVMWCSILDVTSIAISWKIAEVLTRQAVCIQTGTNTSLVVNDEQN